jgi:uridine kinase
MLPWRLAIAIIYGCPMSDRKAFLVGIGGGSCSGKSTLAAALEKAVAPLSCEVVSIDRFMLHDRGPMVTLSTGEEHPNNNHPLSTDNGAALAAIQASQADVVLVEGLMALHHPEFRALYNLALFVELDAPTRAVRRVVRSAKRQPEKSLEWIGRYYLECAVPGHDEFVAPSRQHADLIVRGVGDTQKTAALLALLIQRATA